MAKGEGQHSKMEATLGSKIIIIRVYPVVF